VEPLGNKEQSFERDVSLRSEVAPAHRLVVTQVLKKSCKVVQMFLKQGAQTAVTQTAVDQIPDREIHRHKANASI
jgi:hypothetical protein